MGAPVALAEESAAGSTGQIEIVVVTERAVREELMLTPGGVTLVDGFDLRERNVANLSDLLRYVPGVWSASQSGGDAVFISSRGSNLDATDYDMNGVKLLQDGLPVTTADGNNHNRVLDPLSARYATVARGANAMRYGATTLGGAVDFSSPTARNTSPVEIFANLGSHEQSLARATLSTVFDGRLDGLLTIEGKRWDGYRRHNGQRRGGLYSNVGWRLSDRLTTRVFASYLDNDQELPGALSRAQFEADPRQASTSAVGGDFQLDVATLRLASKTSLVLDGERSLDIGISYEEQSLFHPIVDKILAPVGGELVEIFSLLIDTDHRDMSATIRYGHQVGRHDLLLGVTYGRNRVSGGEYRNDGGRANGLRTLVDNDAASLEIYAADRWHVNERWTLELAAQGASAERSVRNTDAASGTLCHPHGSYSRVNPRIGVLYGVGESAHLFANLSRLYEPPTNFELEDEAAGGNDALDAMHGTVIELGARGRTALARGSSLFWDLSFYYAAIRDEILSVEAPDAPGTSLSANIARTTHAGVEAVIGAELALGPATLEPLLSVTLNEFSFEDDPLYGDNVLPAAPRYAVRGELLYRTPGGFHIGPTFDVVGRRFADFANTYRIEPYHLLGLRAGWSSGRWRAFAELRNLGDVKYVATHGVRNRAAPDAELLYPGEPPAAYFGVQAQF